MKTAMIYGPRDVRVEDVDVPQIEPEDVLVRVRASGICGSDVHRYLGTDYGRRLGAYPLNSGHEYCGDVVQVGDAVENFAEGDRVTLGVAWTGGHLGAFSEWVRIPDAERGLHHLPQEMCGQAGRGLDRSPRAAHGRWQRSRRGVDRTPTVTERRIGASLTSTSASR